MVFSMDKGRGKILVKAKVHGLPGGTKYGTVTAYKGKKVGRTMNIQIFGKSKCFDTKKAERYFKERRVKFQAVDVPRYGMSRGELQSVIRAVGLDEVIDWKNPDAALLKYLAYDEAKLDKLVEDPRLIRTPVVRNGKQATVGYCPDVWKTWE